MNIVLMGGNGYIGRNVTREWLRRDPDAQFYIISKSGKNQLLNPHVHNLQADCYDAVAVKAVLPERVDAIANFVGGMGGRDVNVPPAEVMLKVATERDIPVMGFVGGKLGDKDFTSSKAEACALLRKSGRPVAIVEPTLVYGAGRDDKLTKMVPLLKFFGVFNRNMKPVRVEDVAKQLVDGMIQAAPKAGATTAGAAHSGAAEAGASQADAAKAAGISVNAGTTDAASAGTANANAALTSASATK